MAKKICSILATIAFVFMAAVTANAFNVNNHVYEAANGVGDAIVYPAYIAIDTIGTKIRVVNTSSRFSVVAKVVFREGTSSCETRDFLIYLTPNDVWYANITKVNGVTTITSDDESSPVVPLNIGMAQSCNGFDDSIGYVEIYESLAFDSFTLNGGAINGPMDKAILKAAYAEILRTMAAWIPVLNALDCFEDHAPLAFKLDPASPDNYTAQVYRSKSVMAGWYPIGDGTGLKVEKRAVALAHNCNSVILNVQDETRWDNYGMNMPVEIRGALSKAFVHIPFNSANGASTFAVFNWPVKLSCCTSGSPFCDGVVSACDPATNNGDQCKTNCEGIAPNDFINHDCMHTDEAATNWMANGYDMEEHTMQSNPIFSPIPPNVNGPIPVEVYIADLKSFMGKDLTNGYAEGWVRIGMTDCLASRSGFAADNVTFLQYLGSAVIPTFMDVDYDVALVNASYNCSVLNVYADANMTAQLATFDNCSYQVISPDLWPTIVAPGP
jgi:hypothetical protein